MEEKGEDNVTWPDEQSHQPFIRPKHSSVERRRLPVMIRKISAYTCLLRSVGRLFLRPPARSDHPRTLLPSDQPGVNLYKAVVDQTVR